MNIETLQIVILVTVEFLAVVVTAWVAISRLAPEIAKFRAEARSAQANTIESQGRSLDDAWEEIDKLKKRLSVTTVYLVQLIESHRANGIKPPEPPDEMKSDPEIIKLFGSRRAH